MSEEPKRPETEAIRPATSIDALTGEWLKELLCAIEGITGKDVLTVYGDIFPGLDIRVRMAVEGLGADRKDTLLVVLHTGGGLVEEVRNIVQVLRKHYSSVHFLVPIFAMSAGTVLVMSGDEIYMDYFSRLGPIDPQIQNQNGDMVPALSYLHQYERLIKKSEKGRLTTAELMLLQKLDLAQLHKFELAGDLSKSLIQDWLVQYKFKNWAKSAAAKKKRAKEIADALNDHQRWYTHGSSLHKDILVNDLGLKVEDYSEDESLKGAVWKYFWTLLEYTSRNNLLFFVHSREFP